MNCTKTHSRWVMGKLNSGGKSPISMVMAPSCHIDNPFQYDKEVLALSCQCHIIEDFFRHDKGLLPPPGHVEHLFQCDKEVLPLPGHVKHPFRHDEVLVSPCHIENSFQHEDTSFLFFLETPVASSTSCWSAATRRLRDENSVARLSVVL